MGIKHSMERFIKYLKINKEDNSKREFADLNASRRSLILQSVIMIADEEDQHCSFITGCIDYINAHLTRLIWRGTEM